VPAYGPVACEGLCILLRSQMFSNKHLVVSDIVQRRTSVCRFESFRWCVRSVDRRWRSKSLSNQTLSRHCWHRKLRSALMLLIMLLFILSGT